MTFYQAIPTKDNENKVLDTLLDPECKGIMWIESEGWFDAMCRVKYRYEAITHKRLKLDEGVCELSLRKVY